MNIQCLVPKYNNGKYFEAALKSLAEQTVPFTSILVSENHSTDGSSGLIEKLALKYKNVSYFTPAVPAKTYGHNVAELIERMNPEAEYVLIASSDDIWDKHFVERMIRFIKHAPEPIAAVYSDRVLIDSKGKLLGATGNVSSKTIYPVAQYEAFQYFSGGCSYIISGALFRADVVRKAATLARETANSFDWILMMEAARCGSVGYLAQLLFQYRLHPFNTNKLAYSHVPYLTKYKSYLTSVDVKASELFSAKHTLKDVQVNSISSPIQAGNKKVEWQPWAKYIAHKSGAFKLIRGFKYGWV